MSADSYYTIEERALIEINENVAKLIELSQTRPEPSRLEIAMHFIAAGMTIPGAHNNINHDEGKYQVASALDFADALIAASKGKS